MENDETIEQFLEKDIEEKEYVLKDIEEKEYVLKDIRYYFKEQKKMKEDKEDRIRILRDYKEYINNNIEEIKNKYDEEKKRNISDNEGKKKYETNNGTMKKIIEENLKYKIKRILFNKKGEKVYGDSIPQGVKNLHKLYSKLENIKEEGEEKVEENELNNRDEVNQGDEEINVSEDEGDGEGDGGEYKGGEGDEGGEEDEGDEGDEGDNNMKDNTSLGKKEGDEGGEGDKEKVYDEGGGGDEYYKYTKSNKERNSERQKEESNTSICGNLNLDNLKDQLSEFIKLIDSRYRNPDKIKLTREIIKKYQKNIESAKKNNNKLLMNSNKIEKQENEIEKDQKNIDIFNKNRLSNNSNSLSKELLNHTIFPWCFEKFGEHLKKVSSYKEYDKVNKPSLYIKAFETMQKVFRLQTFSVFGQYTDIQKIKGNKNEKYSVSKTIKKTNVSYRAKPFLSNIKDYLFLYEKNVFIVSHSKFMEQLFKNIERFDRVKYNGKFNNLDIIHLQYKKESDNKYTLCEADIRRVYYDYKLHENEKISLSEKNTDTKHVLIMRHCYGCHNYTKSRLNKAIQSVKDEKGYLQLASCMKGTIDTLFNKRESLLTLFNSIGTYEEFDFGSSIIYRAVLTSLLVQKILYSPITYLHSNKNTLQQNNNNLEKQIKQNKENIENIENIEKIKKSDREFKLQFLINKLKEDIKYAYNLTSNNLTINKNNPIYNKDTYNEFLVGVKSIINTIKRYNEEKNNKSLSIDYNIYLDDLIKIITFLYNNKTFTLEKLINETKVNLNTEKRKVFFKKNKKLILEYEKNIENYNYDLKNNTFKHNNKTFTLEKLINELETMKSKNTENLGTENPVYVL